MDPTTPKDQIVKDGAIAGVLGAATVSSWFLLFDASRYRLLETPALLASVLLHNSAKLPTLPLVAEFTVFHLFAFVTFGILCAILLEAAERNRALLTPLLVVAGAFEAAFVILVIVLAPEFKGAISWWSVLVGNLLATAVMAGYFFVHHPKLGEVLFGPSVTILAEGAAAGAIGATAVILWFVFYDLGSGSNPFRTPGLLAGVILEGARNASTTPSSGSPLVLGYTVLHYAVFVAFGVVLAGLAASLDGTDLWVVVLLVFCIFQSFFVGFASVLSDALVQIGWGTIVAANLISAIAMIGFLYWRRPVAHSSRNSKAGEIPSNAEASVPTTLT
jgi:hypothetical protein